jgi:hypothetical protein
MLDTTLPSSLDRRPGSVATATARPGAGCLLVMGAELAWLARNAMAQPLALCEYRV